MILYVGYAANSAPNGEGDSIVTSYHMYILRDPRGDKICNRMSDPMNSLPTC